MSVARKGLGLGALIRKASETQYEPGAVKQIHLDEIIPNRRQPRTAFPEGAIEELAASIRENGVLQPVIIRPMGDRYELVAGERRWRAARQAGLSHLPAIVRITNDEDTLLLALVENLQRDDLDPLETASGYQALIEQFGLTQDEVATRVGKARATIANSLRLLELPDQVKAMLRAGEISTGHAKVLLSLADPNDQLHLAYQVKLSRLSVRELEALLTKGEELRSKSLPGRKKQKTVKDPHLAELEALLRERFGTKVAVHMGRHLGRVVIEFYSNEDLERILEICGVRGATENIQ